MEMNDSGKLAEHFFRSEYGKMVAVITKYIGTENVETAEDIVQETLLKAVESWTLNEIPENPQAWLYVTAKNMALNVLKRKKHFDKYQAELQQNDSFIEEITFSDKIISDELLRMMFTCCPPAISTDTQIALMLKILCGFSISEIASAFFTSNETINKRLVRGRKKMKTLKVSMENESYHAQHVAVVLSTIYLLFNEGYSPTERNELVRFDLCLESIRLAEILNQSEVIQPKTNCQALLALMYLNASRFDSRTNGVKDMIEMEQQDREKWNRDLINKGIYFLNQATKEAEISHYLILATISANHCIAPSFEQTNWSEILALYDSLLSILDQPIIRLNRAVALSKVQGNESAILELEKLNSNTSIGESHLFHSVLGEFYRQERATDKAVDSFKKAMTLTRNKRDLKFIQKKLTLVVPIAPTQL